MGRLHRAQVLLEPAQYRRLRRIAARRSLEEGRRVSVSQVIRELLDQALEKAESPEERARAALARLFTLGDAVRKRHAKLLPENWLNSDRDEHDDERFADLFPGR